MQGQLFTQDFLTRGVFDTPPCQSLDGAVFTAFSNALHGLFKGLSGASTINEAQTEQLIINKVLAELGWSDDTLPQVNADPKGREAVPDCLLFASSATKAAALAETKDDRRYRHGLAILEAKRWLRPLDRGDGQDAFDPDAPSSQMLRYLSRVDVVLNARQAKRGGQVNFKELFRARAGILPVQPPHRAVGQHAPFDGAVRGNIDPAQVAQHLRRRRVGIERVLAVTPVERAQPALGLQNGQAVAVAAVVLGFCQSGGLGG